MNHLIGRSVLVSTNLQEPSSASHVNSCLVSCVSISHTSCMRTRSGVGLALFLLATFAAIALMLLRQPQSEPIIQGKRLSVWLTGYQTQGVNPQAWAKADEILLAVGTNAIPTLLRMLRQQDSPFKLLLMQLAQRQHMVRLRFIRAEDRHYQAAIAFAKLGAAARNAVPALIEISNANIS